MTAAEGLRDRDFNLPANLPSRLDARSGIGPLSISFAERRLPTWLTSDKWRSYRELNSAFPRDRGISYRWNIRPYKGCHPRIRTETLGINSAPSCRLDQMTIELKNKFGGKGVNRTLYDSRSACFLMLYNIVGAGHLNRTDASTLRGARHATRPALLRTWREARESNPDALGGSQMPCQ